MNPSFRSALFPSLKGCLPVIAVLTTLLPSTSRAIDIFWAGTTGSYKIAADWGGTIPGGGDNAIVDNGGTVQVNADDPDWAIWDIRAGNAAGTTGNYEQNSRIVTANGWFRLGLAAGSTGTYTINDGTLNTQLFMRIGELGSGILNINGGQVNRTANGDAIIVGSRQGAQGGPDSHGTINHTGGILTTSAELWIADGDLGSGTEGGQYNLSGTGELNISNWFAIGRRGGTGVFTMTGGTVNKTGGGNVTISTGTGGQGTVNQSGGVFNNQNWTFVGESWNGDGNGTWTLSGTGEANLTDLIVGNGGACTGTFNLDGGTLTANVIRTTSTGTSTFNFNGGTLRPGADRADFMTGLSAGNIGTGGAVIDTNGFSIGIAQDLVDAGGSGDLTKNGAGTLTLTGFNTYSGATVVNEGQLNTTTDSTGGGSYTVADNAALGVTTAVIDDQLAVSTLTLGDNATLEIDLGSVGGGTSQPIAAPVNVTGDLAVNGTVTINYLDENPIVGQFPLIAYATVGGSSGLGGLVLGELPAGVEATLVTTTAGLIELNITRANYLEWEGLTDAVWDIATTDNWYHSYTNTGNATYLDGDPVSFLDYALGNTAITLDVTVMPEAVLVDNAGTLNAGLDYSISGSGKISGATGLTKRGLGPLTISTANDYTGVTRFEGGTLSVASLADGGSPSPIGAATPDAANLVFDGGTLVVTGATGTDHGFTIAGGGGTLDTQADVAFSGEISGIAGQFSKTGPATLTLSNPGTNTLVGTGYPAVNVLDGTLAFDGSGSQLTEITGELWVGSSTANGADLQVTDSTLTMTSWLAVGRINGDIGNVTNVTFTNSSVQAQNFSTGFGADQPNLSTQNITLVDSDLTIPGNTNIAESSGSTSNLTLSGDSSYLTNVRLLLAMAADSTANVVISGTSSMEATAEWVSIGQNGTATMTISDSGSFTSHADFNVSDIGNSQGTLILEDDGLVQANGSIFVGKNAGTISGLVTQTGGTFNGGGGGVFQIGQHSFGTWNQSGGTTNADGWVALGRFADGTGILDVSGGTFNQTGAGNALIVAELGSGTLTISGTGTVTSIGAFGLTIGNGGGAFGTVNLDAGGTLSVPVVRTAGGTSTFNFDGGVLQAATGAQADFMTGLTFANVLAGGAIIDTNANTVAIGQDLLEDFVSTGGGLTKQGDGCLFLNGTSDYAGPTTVSAGFLGGNGSITSNVTVAAGAGLAAVVTDPGGAAGIDWSVLDITGTLTLPDPLVIKIDSLGAAPLPETGGTMTIATTTGGINPLGAVSFDLTSFTGTGSFVASIVGNDLVVDYTAGSGDDYDTWGAAQSWTFGDPGTGKTDDYDGDGLSNEDEYAFGLDPTSAASVSPVSTPLDKTAGTFTYTRRDPALTGLAYSYEWSINLDGSWTPVVPAVADIVTPVGATGNQTVTVDLTGAPGNPLANATLLVRVRAQ